MVNTFGIFVKMCKMTCQQLHQVRPHGSNFIISSWHCKGPVSLSEINYMNMHGQHSLHTKYIIRPSLSCSSHVTAMLNNINTVPLPVGIELQTTMCNVKLCTGTITLCSTHLVIVAAVLIGQLICHALQKWTKT